MKNVDLKTAAELAKFDSKLLVGSASLPPAYWYHSPEFLNAEKESVFSRNWLYAGRMDQLLTEGAFLSGRYLNEPYFIIRTANGELKAYNNVCQHHAACLVEGSGVVKNLTCPYHGWTYDLDGSLIAAPRTKGIQNFCLKDYSLPQLEVESIGPFVFIHFSRPDRQIRNDLAPLFSRLEASGISKLKFHKQVTYEIQCNWKVYVDNYLDGGYHVPTLHRNLASQLDLSSYKTELYERYSVQTSQGAPSEKRIGKEALYAWIYPNFMVNRYGPAMDTNWIIPVSAEKTLTVFDFYFDPTHPDYSDEFLHESLSQSDRVQQEDIQICESVQIGLKSQGFRQGRYAPIELAEHSFHKLLSEELSRLF